MSLSRGAKRAYIEARHRILEGGPSPGWKAKPGSEYEVEIWMNAFQLAHEEDISPWDALLLAVRRRAQRVRAVDRVLEAVMAEHVRLCNEDPEYKESHNPDVPPAEARIWLAESRNEERLLVRSAKMAVDAGVADAVVRRLELEGRLVTDALVAGLDSLNLTADQRLLALSTMHRQLAQLPGEVESPHIVEGFEDTEHNSDDDTDGG